MHDRQLDNVGKSRLSNRIKKMKSMTVGSIVKAMNNNVSFRIKQFSNRIKQFSNRVKNKRWDYYRRNKLLN